MSGFLVILDSSQHKLNVMQTAKQWRKKKKKKTQHIWCLSKYSAKSRPPEWSCSLHWDTIFCYLFIWGATSRISTGVNLWVKEQEKKKSRQLLRLREAGSCRHPSSLAYDLRPSSQPPTDQRDFHHTTAICTSAEDQKAGRKWERAPMRVSCKRRKIDWGGGVAEKGSNLLDLKTGKTS